MNWIYGLKEKVKIAMALAIVFLLVLITNMINKNHFEELQESFTSVYEDRLLVENYIYKLSRELNAKRMSLLDNSYKNLEAANTRIDQLIKDFQGTYLTDEEAKTLATFVENSQKLSLLENQYQNSVKSKKDTLKADLQRQYQRLNDNLLKLSNIQLEEGRKLMKISNDIVATNHWYSRLEIVVLIGIGLIIQILIFASKSLKPKLPQNQHLN